MQVILTNIRCVLKIKLRSVYVEISELPLFVNEDLPIGGRHHGATRCGNIIYFRNWWGKYIKFRVFQLQYAVVSFGISRMGRHSRCGSRLQTKEAHLTTESGSNIWRSQTGVGPREHNKASS
jgi:hypothetical protein